MIEAIQFDSIRLNSISSNFVDVFVTSDFMYFDLFYSFRYSHNTAILIENFKNSE